MTLMNLDQTPLLNPQVFWGFLGWFFLTHCDFCFVPEGRQDKNGSDHFIYYVLAPFLLISRVHEQ